MYCIPVDWTCVLGIHILPLPFVQEIRKVSGSQGDEDTVSVPTEGDPAGTDYMFSNHLLENFWSFFFMLVQFVRMITFSLSII